MATDEHQQDPTVIMEVHAGDLLRQSAKKKRRNQRRALMGAAVCLAACVAVMIGLVVTHTNKKGSDNKKKLPSSVGATGLFADATERDLRCGDTTTQAGTAIFVPQYVPNKTITYMSFDWDVDRGASWANRDMTGAAAGLGFAAGAWTFYNGSTTGSKRTFAAWGSGISGASSLLNGFKIVDGGIENINKRKTDPSVKTIFGGTNTPDARVWRGFNSMDGTFGTKDHPCKMSSPVLLPTATPNQINRYSTNFGVQAGWYPKALQSWLGIDLATLWETPKLGRVEVVIYPNGTITHHISDQSNTLTGLKHSCSSDDVDRTNQIDKLLDGPLDLSGYTGVYFEEPNWRAPGEYPVRIVNYPEPTGSSISALNTYAANGGSYDNTFAKAVVVDGPPVSILKNTCLLAINPSSCPEGYEPKTVKPSKTVKTVKPMKCKKSKKAKTVKPTPAPPGKKK